MKPEKIFQLALQRFHEGELEQAESLIREVIGKQPNDLKALNFMGMILTKLRKYEPAIEFFRRALSLSPLSADLHYNMGTVLKDAGRFDEAITHYQRALQINPEHFESHHNLGHIFQRKKEIDQAILYYQEALKRNPNLADAYYNLGTIAQDKKYLNEAILFYQKALQLAPNLDDAYYRLGSVYADTEQLADAISCYQKALQINPRLAPAHNGLGIVMQKMHEIDRAMEQYRQAVTLMPDFVEAHINMGNALRDFRFSEGAEQWYRQALSIAPDCTFCYDNLFFLMLYHEWYDASTVFSEHLKFAQHCAEPLSSAINPHANTREPDRILKIGYVSPDFRKHAVSYFTEPVITAHSKEDFQIFCYSDVSRDDAIAERLRQHVFQWQNIKGMPDQQVADLIHSDGIDILVDLAGHTAHNRLLVFARKPAPVQVTWIGYPATTGLSAMDYKIVDAHTDPPGMTEQFYTEKLIRMPESFLCYLPDGESPAVGPLPCLSAGHITFGSFNNFAKVNPGVITMWAQILLGVPGSRFIMKANGLADKTAARIVMDMFGKNGINADRIELHGLIPSSGMHLGLYNRVDIGLDTFPYNGTTTTCEALWMGVPVITLAGKTHAGRVGSSLLANAGLAELIAETPDDYKEKAVLLVQDLKRMQTLRESLRERMAQSPLTDAKRFTANLEKCYRDIWIKWCKSAASAVGSR
jgi:predicted O-linked N-acetylglucosamine transferase (SPINDLY family)